MSEIPEAADVPAAPVPRTARDRWIMGALFAGTLILVSILLFVRVRETEVELDLTASELSFTLWNEQALTGAVPLPVIGVAGVEAIDIPAALHQHGRTLRHSESAVRLSTASEGTRSGSITLGALTAHSGTQVTIRALESKDDYRLSLAGGGTDFRVDVEGPVAMTVAGSPRETLHFVTPNPVVLHPGRGETDLDLHLPMGHPDVFSPQLSVEKLRLYRIDESAGAKQTLLRRVSTILSGTLYMEALDGQQRRVREGEPLEFAESRGVIRVLRLKLGRVQVSFHGTVRGMETGWGEGRRSLMPTCLDWLHARHAMVLLWGSALYLFGLVAGVLRWWGMQV